MEKSSWIQLDHNSVEDIVNRTSKCRGHAIDLDKFTHMHIGVTVSFRTLILDLLLEPPLDRKVTNDASKIQEQVADLVIWYVSPSLDCFGI